MKKNDEKAESVLVELFGEIHGEISEFADPLKAVAESAKETMRKCF